MTPTTAKIAEFIAFVQQHIRGDEKGEAQIFCDRLFKAFGHPGILEAGGQLEFRVHKGKSTKFADLRLVKCRNGECVSTEAKWSTDD